MKIVTYKQTKKMTLNNLEQEKSDTKKKTLFDFTYI